MDDENIVKDQSVLSSSSASDDGDALKTIGATTDTKDTSDVTDAPDLQELLEEIHKHDVVIETAVIHMDNMVSNIQTLGICSSVLLAVLIGCILSSILSRFFRG